LESQRHVWRAVSYVSEAQSEEKKMGGRRHVRELAVPGSLFPSQVGRENTPTFSSLSSSYLSPSLPYYLLQCLLSILCNWLNTHFFLSILQWTAHILGRVVFRLKPFIIRIMKLEKDFYNVANVRLSVLGMEEKIIIKILISNMHI
jgi:hypothetical protein